VGRRVGTAVRGLGEGTAGSLEEWIWTVMDARSAAITVCRNRMVFAREVF
jgi:hypothetical protein